MVALDTGSAAQGIVLSPFLFILYTLDFCYNNIPKYSDDSAVVGFISDRQKVEFRKLVGDFVAWYGSNHFSLLYSHLLGQIFRASHSKKLNKLTKKNCALC